MTDALAGELAGAELSLSAVLEHVRADAAAGRFAAWGASTVVDEHTGSAVVDRATFAALHAAAGIAARFPVGNAGVVHVYGYWFSTTPTPFGRKRDRWVDGRLATALGLAPDAFHLGAGPAGTTLLQRVTEAAGRALDDPGADAVGAAEAVVGALRTRAVLVRAPGASATALVYGVGVPSELRLVTAFPVDGDPEPLLVEFRSEPRLRWNAVAQPSPTVHLPDDNPSI